MAATTHPTALLIYRCHDTCATAATRLKPAAGTHVICLSITLGLRSGVMIRGHFIGSPVPAAAAAAAAAAATPSAATTTTTTASTSSTPATAAAAAAAALADDQARHALEAHHADGLLRQRRHRRAPWRRHMSLGHFAHCWTTT